MLRDLPLLSRALRDDARSLVAWGLGFTGLMLLYFLFYPAVRDNPEFNELIANYPPEVLALIGTADITSPVGFMNAEFFQYVGPVMILIYVLRRTADAVAGAEEAGTLELVLAQPVPRWRIVLERYAATALGAGALGSVVFLLLAVGGRAVELTIAPHLVLAQVASLVLLALLFGALGLAVGAATGRRGLALGAPSVAAVVAWLVDTFAPLVEAMEVLEPLSPWEWYIGNVPLANGVVVWDVLLFLVLIGACLAVAVWGFERRDVGV